MPRLLAKSDGAAGAGWASEAGKALLSVSRATAECHPTWHHHRLLLVSSPQRVVAVVAVVALARPARPI